MMLLASAKLPVPLAGKYPQNIRLPPRVLRQGWCSLVCRPHFSFATWKPHLCAHLAKEQMTWRFDLYVCEPLHRIGRFSHALVEGKESFFDVHGDQLDVMSASVSLDISIPVELSSAKWAFVVIFGWPPSLENSHSVKLLVFLDSCILFLPFGNQ